MLETFCPGVRGISEMGEPDTTIKNKATALRYLISWNSVSAEDCSSTDTEEQHNALRENL
jgi:hypothetical protein